MTMADKTKRSEAVAQSVGRKVPLEKHRRNCLDLYGVTPSTFDGATVGLSGEFTNEEMKAIISRWLEQEVK